MIGSEDDSINNHTTCIVHDIDLFSLGEQQYLQQILIETSSLKPLL